MEKIIHTLQNLTHLSWSKIRNSSGPAGSFLKSQEDTAEGRIYYKLSDYDSYHGIVGHESINEIIADRLLTILDMADKPVQCFVGSRSAWGNLHLIPQGQYQRVRPLKETDRAVLVDGLDDPFSNYRLERTWEMIWRRWQAYEALRNQG